MSFFFNDTATTEIYTLSLHDALPIYPYRWLEDDNADETKAWVAEQNRLTFGYLEKIPQRTRIKQRLTELWNYERWGVPRSEEHTSELQSRQYLVCRLLLEKKNITTVT